MAETFKLPASSLEEIIKIIQAYANEKEGIMLALDDITPVSYTHPMLNTYATIQMREKYSQTPK